MGEYVKFTLLRILNLAVGAGTIENCAAKSPQSGKNVTGGDCIATILMLSESSSHPIILPLLSDKDLSNSFASSDSKIPTGVRG